MKNNDAANHQKIIKFGGPNYDGTFLVAVKTRRETFHIFFFILGFTRFLVGSIFFIYLIYVFLCFFTVHNKLMVTPETNLADREGDDDKLWINLKHLVWCETGAFLSPPKINTPPPCDF